MRIELNSSLFCVRWRIVVAVSDENKPKNDGQLMRERALRGIPEEARLPDNDKPDLIEGTSREIAFIYRAS